MDAAPALVNVLKSAHEEDEIYDEHEYQVHNDDVLWNAHIRNFSRKPQKPNSCKLADLYLPRPHMWPLVMWRNFSPSRHKRLWS
jgi:hypothetical protein